MTIRSKLLLFYSIMMVAVLMVGTASIWAMLRWRQAAEDLAAMRQKSLQAEKLRAGMYRQINYGLDYLSGEITSEQEFKQIEKQVQKQLEYLKQQAYTQEERDHIEGLEETRFELNWMLLGIFQKIHDSPSALNLTDTHSRLREMAEEVADDVAVLIQFYRAQVDQSVKAASGAGNYAAIIVGVAVVIAFVQLIALIFLTQRWLVRPIASVSKATKVISTGDFDTRVTLSSEDEWGRLARSINDMAKSLKTLQHQLQTKERFAALGEVAAFTAHNIQNPLAGIRAAAQVTLKELPPENSEPKESLIDIIQSVDRLSQWIKRLLNFAKPVDLHKKTTDLNKVIIQALTTTHSTLTRDDIIVKTNLMEDLPLIQIDPILIEQTISSIITNAFEAGGNTVNIKTACTGEQDSEKWLSISIIDNGNGISPDIKPKLFKAFVTNKKSGTGLGLALAKKIIDLHDGELTLDSSTNKGTSVLIKLPLRADIGIEDSHHIS